MLQTTRWNSRVRQLASPLPPPNRLSWTIAISILSPFFDDWKKINNKALMRHWGGDTQIQKSKIQALSCPQAFTYYIVYKIQKRLWWIGSLLISFVQLIFITCRHSPNSNTLSNCCFVYLLGTCQREGNTLQGEFSLQYAVRSECYF